MKKGDRYPYLEGTLREGGTAINAEAPVNAVAVKIRVKKPGGSAETKVAEWVSKTKGEWRYKWVQADIESGGLIFEEGSYQLEVIVEWEAGVTEHFPTEGHNTFTVTAAL